MNGAKLSEMEKDVIIKKWSFGDERASYGLSLM